jgi:hypothetical protein
MFYHVFKELTTYFLSFGLAGWFEKRVATFARRLREKQQHASKPVFMHVSSTPMECAIAGKQSRRPKQGCVPDNKKIDRNGVAIGFRTACRPVGAPPITCPNVPFALWFGTPQRQQRAPAATPSAEFCGERQRGFAREWR